MDILRGDSLEMEIIKELRVKMIKSFMKIFILAQLRKNAMSAYDIIASIHEKFGIMVSSGTVYTRIYQRRENHQGRSKREKTNSKVC